MRSPLADVLAAAADLAQREHRPVHVPVHLAREAVEALRDLEAIALAGEPWARHVARHGRLAPLPFACSSPNPQESTWTTRPSPRRRRA